MMTIGSIELLASEGVGLTLVGEAKASSSSEWCPSMELRGEPRVLSLWGLSETGCFPSDGTSDSKNESPGPSDVPNWNPPTRHCDGLFLAGDLPLPPCLFMVGDRPLPLGLPLPLPRPLLLLLLLEGPLVSLWLSIPCTAHTCNGCSFF